MYSTLSKVGLIFSKIKCELLTLVLETVMANNKLFPLRLRMPLSLVRWLWIAGVCFKGRGWLIHSVC